MEEKGISRAVIKRLPRYYRYLGELLEDGAERISSGELSERMKVTASQIRQDLNNFGGFGQQGYGYNVLYLYSEIGKILGLDRVHNMIFVGAGNLGQALANYAAFERSGFKTVGIFDVNPVLKGISVRGIEIRMADELPEFIKEHHVEIAALTLPKAKADGRDSRGQRCKSNLEFCTYRSKLKTSERCDRRERPSFRKSDASLLQSDQI